MTTETTPAAHPFPAPASAPPPARRPRRAVPAALGALAVAAPLALGAGAAGATPGPSAAAAAAAAAATTIVVAVDGDDAAEGSLDDPVATLQEGVDRAGPGDTIEVRGGTYTLTENVTIDTSGEPGNPITLRAYDGERVIVDGEELPASHTPIGGTIPREERGSIHQEASHWRIEGLELIRGPYGIYCDGCNDNEFVDLTTRDNYETGFQLQGESSGNLIQNLDSYGNHDPRKNGESADGLGIKEGSGEGNRVVGARLWNNADDGFDAWEFESAIEIEDSIAYGNGVNRWDLPDYSGDGNGFKLGGSGEEVPAAAHTLHNCVAFENAVDGVDDNGNPGALEVSRTTTYANGGKGFDMADAAGVLTANLSLLDGEPVDLGDSESTGNSWDLGGEWDEDSVLSTDPTAITGDREADGSIPSSEFLVPRDGTEIGAAF